MVERGGQMVGSELQSNNENREHQKYFWNVIVLQEKKANQAWEN